MATERAQRRAARGARLLIACAIGLSGALFGIGTASAHTPHDSIADVALSPAFAQDDTLYTISREYLLQSEDRGETWHRLVRGLDNKFLLSSIEVSQQDARVLYAATRGDGVYRSADGGGSWTKVNAGLEAGLDVAVLAVSPHADDVVFAATAAGVLFQTSDGGASWHAVDVPAQHVTTIAFVPGEPETVLIGDAHGDVYRSDDTGETWDALALAGDAGAVNGIAVSPEFAQDRTLFVAAERGMFASTDGGTSFAATNKGISDERMQSVVVSPAYADDATVWASSWDDGVYVSSDGGSSWSRHSSGLTGNSQAKLLGVPEFRQLQVADADDAGMSPTLVLAGFDGLFRSDDGADSWTQLQTQVATYLGAVALSPDYANDSTLAVATYINGAFRSTDAGAEWTAIDKGLAHRVEWLRQPDYVARLTGIWFAPTYTDDHTMFVTSRGYVFRSTNRGRSWQRSTPPGMVVKGEFPPDYSLLVFSPQYATDSTLFLGTDGGKVFTSTDGGDSYAKLAQLDVEISSLVISDDFAQDATLVAGTPEGVYKSVDGGVSWSATAAVPKPVTSVAISPAYGSDHTLFAGSVGGLLRSADSGATWTPVTGAPFGDRPYVESVVVSPEFASDGTVLVSARGAGLYKSEDRGVTFRPVAEDLIAGGRQIANFYHPTSEPIVFSPSYATDATVYALAATTLLRSEDGAETWTAMQVPRFEHELDDASAPNPLLAVPRYGRDDVARDRLDFSRKGMVAAAIAGAIVFAALQLLRLPRWKSVWTYVVRVGAAVVVFVATLAFFAVT